LIQLLAVLAVSVPLFIIGSLVHPLLGMAFALLGILLVTAVMSAVHTIFVSAVYHNITNEPVKHFNQAMADNLFVSK